MTEKEPKEAVALIPAKAKTTVPIG